MESEEQKFRYFCQHASSAFRRTFEHQELSSTIEKHHDDVSRNHALCEFLEKIQDTKDIESMSRNVVTASKALACCGGANLYRVEVSTEKADSVLNMPVDSTGMHGVNFVTQVRIGSEIHERRFTIDRGIPGEVYQSGGPVLVNTPSAAAFVDSEIDDPGDGGSCRNALGLPIFSKVEPGKVTGVLVLFNSFAKDEHGLGDRDFDDADVDRFRMFALWIALFLRHPLAMQVSVQTINNICHTSSLKQPNAHTSMLDNRAESWDAISQAVMAGTNCQALVALQVVRGEADAKDLLECVYPFKNAGHRLSCPAGILKQVDLFTL